MPTPLVLFAGVVALLPLARLLRRPVSGPHLMVEAYVTALVVTLHSPNEQDFYGKTLEEGLAWCLLWLMAPELAWSHSWCEEGPAA